MSKVISAVFDHADLADHALAEMRRNGINVQAYKTSPSHPNRTSRTNSEPETPTIWGAPVNLGAPDITNMDMVSGASMPINIGAAPWIPGIMTDPFTNGGGSGYTDTRSDEVLIKVTVDDNQASDAQAALISFGGRQVKSA